MSKSQNIIQRRELEPLLLRAREIVKYYEKAAECTVSVLGPDCDLAETSPPGTMLFCALCRQYCHAAGQSPAPKDCPCAAIHLNGVQEARRLGGSYIYMCPVGFIFWTSPIYTGERFAGALMSSGVLSLGRKPAGVNRQQAAENIFRICGGAVSRQDIERHLEKIPEKTDTEIKALAQMMLICAEQISAGEAPLSPEKTRSRAAMEPVRGAENTANGDEAGRERWYLSGENGYPLDRERALLASLRRGDHEEARQILKELLDILLSMSNGSFELFQLRAIELTVMLSRAAANEEDTEDVNLLETNNRYLKKIEEAHNPAVIYEILNIIINRISGKIFFFQGIRHSSALRKAERFIWENYTRKISLEEIASASGLSAPYFSTIFKDEMGENLSNYLNRLRVEKAAGLLAETDLPISGIAAACGFEDQSWFSKIFKNHTGLSPGKYREQGGGLAFSLDHSLPPVACNE
jgi:AraC-like DNA-binding protein/ligand-binding sensor protein